MNKYEKWISLIGIALVSVWIYHSASVRASSVNTTPVYNTSGVEQLSDRIVIGRATLSLGSVTVTLTGKAVFSSASSYSCALADGTGLNLTSVNYTSGSQFVINGVAADQISFACVGN